MVPRAGGEKGAAGRAWRGRVLGAPQNGRWEHHREEGGTRAGMGTCGQWPPPAGPQGIRRLVPQLSLSGQGIFRAAG